MTMTLNGERIWRLVVAAMVAAGMTWLAVVPAEAVSASGQKTCYSPNTSWAQGGTSSGYLLVEAGSRSVSGNQPYYFTRSVDSGRYGHPVFWTASGPNLQYGKGYCS